jgi:ribonuclease P protein component
VAHNNTSFFTINTEKLDISFYVMKKSEDFGKILRVNKKISCRNCTAFYDCSATDVKNMDKRKKELLYSSSDGYVDNIDYSAEKIVLHKKENVKHEIIVKIGYIASKKLGHAVKRNLAKRQLRAALRVALQNMLVNGYVQRLEKVILRGCYITGDSFVFNKTNKNSSLNILLMAKISKIPIFFAELASDIAYIMRKSFEAMNLN